LQRKGLPVSVSLQTAAVLQPIRLPVSVSLQTAAVRQPIRLPVSVSLQTAAVLQPIRLPVSVSLQTAAVLQPIRLPVSVSLRNCCCTATDTATSQRQSPQLLLYGNRYGYQSASVSATAAVLQPIRLPVSVSLRNCCCNATDTATSQRQSPQLLLYCNRYVYQSASVSATAAVLQPIRLPVSVSLRNCC